MLPKDDDAGTPMQGAPHSGGARTCLGCSGDVPELGVC